MKSFGTERMRGGSGHRVFRLRGGESEPFGTDLLIDPSVRHAQR